MIYIMYRPLSEEAGAYEQSVWMLDGLTKAESTTEKVVLPYSEGRKVINELKKGDIVYFRNIGSELGMCKRIAIKALEVGAKVIDSYLIEQIDSGGKFGPLNKEDMYAKMIDKGVATPASELITIADFINGNYTGIIKTVVGGRQGNGTYVYLEKDADKKKQIVDDIMSKPRQGKDGLIVQEYIPNKGDIRVVCVGYEMVAATKRKPKDTSLLKMNTSQGTSKLIKRPKSDIRSFAKDVVAKMQIDVASMDILRDSRNGKLYVVDLNESPTVKILSIRSKKDIPGIIVRYLDELSMEANSYD